MLVRDQEMSVYACSLFVLLGKCPGGWREWRSGLEGGVESKLKLGGYKSSHGGAYGKVAGEPQGEL